MKTSIYSEAQIIFFVTPQHLIHLTQQKCLANE